MHYYVDVLKKYAVFEGRAARKEYWMFVLWNSIIYIIIATVVGMLTVNLHSYLYLLIDGAYILATLLPMLGVSVRRLHDTDRSGWWYLVGVIPFVGAIILLVCMVSDSDHFQNRFGPNPKGA